MIAHTALSSPTSFEIRPLMSKRTSSVITHTPAITTSDLIWHKYKHIMPAIMLPTAIGRAPLNVGDMSMPVPKSTAYRPAKAAPPGLSVRPIGRNTRSPDASTISSAAARLEPWL